MRIQVVVTTTFEAIHSWPDCPYEDVAFLRSPHRHIFHVVMKWKVDHVHRHIEFIRQKRLVESFIKQTWDGRDLGGTSCEALAVRLHKAFPNCCFVSILEDGENGAEVHFDAKPIEDPSDS